MTPHFFKTITVASLQYLQKKVDDRLTDTLVAEYSLGYTPCGDRSSDKRRGIQILTDLRAHHKNLFVVAKLTAAVVATSGLATEPRALLNAKTELQGVGVAVTSEIHVCAVERALNSESTQPTGHMCGESSAQSLAPCRRTPQSMGSQ